MCPAEKKDANKMSHSSLNYIQTGDRVIDRERDHM